MKRIILYIRSLFLTKEQRFILSKVRANELLFKEKNGNYWFAQMEINKPVERYINENDLYFLKNKGFIIFEKYTSDSLIVSINK